MRTFADWNDPAPGSMEMDLVAHCGPVNRGSYVNSLVLTDIATGWTEAAPIVVREGSLVVETLDRIRAGLPFALQAVDVDNVLSSKASPTADEQYPGSRRQWHREAKTSERLHQIQQSSAAIEIPR